MTIDFLPEQREEAKPRITVFGVGGAGGNAVNNMISGQLDGVEFVVANTDSQSLAQSLAEHRIQLGVNITHGLGAGARPDIGRVAAEEVLEEIQQYLDGNNMVFITGGMGGGTGTGAAPVIARAAREQGILTVGVVTKPFQFEGIQRMRIAEDGLKELQQYVDTLIVIPNQNLFRIASEQTTFAEAFKMADDVLHAGVRGVTDLMVNPGLVNLDFADIRTVMGEMGKAMMGTGEAEGQDRATEAAEAAINNPLLDNASIEGAQGVLINITGGTDITLHEIDTAATRICNEVDEDANIIFGTSLNAELEGRMRVAVIATGIDADAVLQPIPEPSDNIHVLGFTGRRGGESRGTSSEAAHDSLDAHDDLQFPSGENRENRMDVEAHSDFEADAYPLAADEVAANAAAPGHAQMVEHTRRTVAATSGGGVAAGVTVRRQVRYADPALAGEAEFAPEMMADPDEVPAPRTTADPFIAPPPTEPVARRASEFRTAKNGKRSGSRDEGGQARRRGPTIFERMTGTGRARTEPEAAVEPPSSAVNDAADRQASLYSSTQEPTLDAPQPAAPEEHKAADVRFSEDDPLDIPAFLRRQAN